jgi:Skp family chaperone for outer membrane proteins
MQGVTVEWKCVAIDFHRAECQDGRKESRVRQASERSRCNAILDQKGSATMSDDAQPKLAREIDRKAKTLASEDDEAQSGYEQEHADTTQALLKKFRAVVGKYARDNRFGLVIDVSNPRTPSFWWANAMDIANDVVRAYDAAYSAAAGK